MIKVLLCEDDNQIVLMLTEYLATAGFQVISASGQAMALRLMRENEFDLVLLDISLADGNGYAVCSAIKSEYNTPVIFLTASGDEYSTVTGFDVGADDYIAKPFRPRELVSRMKNILRLTRTGGAAVRIGPITVDTVKGTATKNGVDLYLSALEYRLLLMFVNNRGAVLTRTALVESIWDVAGEYVNDNTLTVYIKRLREKVEDNPADPKVILTVRGIGYRMDG